MAQPVFVIGRIRSGTKWLSNLLAAQSDVAAISGRSVGILSTCMFDRLPDTFGDLRVDSNFYAFAACYSKSDFFRLTGLPEEFLLRQKSRRYADIFREMMDAYAERQGKSVWVQKSKSIYLPHLFRHFPEAKYVIIRRNLDDNLRSTIGLAMSHGRGHANVVTTTLSYYHHLKTEERYANRENVHVVRFEDLKADTEAVVRRVCTFLDIDFQSSMLDTGYAPNTSYRGKIEREKVMRPVDRLLLKAAPPIIRGLPLPLLERLHRLKENRRKQPFREVRLLPSYFNMLKRELEGEEQVEGVEGAQERVTESEVADRAAAGGEVTDNEVAGGEVPEEKVSADRKRPLVTAGGDVAKTRSET